jgi:uncharacterized membrane protein
MSVQLKPPRSLWRTIYRLEDDERLDGAARVLDGGAGVVGRDRVGSILRGDWLGHALHPLLTDLPLGCWAAATALDLTAWRRDRLAARRLIGVGLLFAVPTAAAGLADFGTLREQRSRRVAVVHATGNAAAMALYVASWRARRHGHHVVGRAASLLGGVLAVGTGYLGGHLSFVRGAGTGERGRLQTAIALPEHTGETTGDGPPRVQEDRRAAATIEVVTPTITEQQHDEIRRLPHCMVETASSGSSPTSEEVHLAFQFPTSELTVENLRALSAEASRIAGAARLVYRDGDPDVMRLVETANAG